MGSHERAHLRPDGTLVEWIRGDSTPLDKSFEQVLRERITEQRDYLAELVGA